MVITQELTDRLLRLKETAGLTYDQISELVGTSPANARRYINGEVKAPDIRILCDIIRALGAAPKELLFPASADPPDQDEILYDKIFANMEARFVRQERRHQEDLEMWREKYDAEICAIRQSLQQALQTKDDWIDLIRQERDEARAKERQGARNRQKLLWVLLILSLLLGFLFAAYVIPDLIDRSNGLFVY